MSLSLEQNYTAVIPGVSFVQFVASGGTPPYSYSVLPNGAGGSIDSLTGAYTAPALMTAYPANALYDTIEVVDSLSANIRAQILIGTPLFLFCDILQNQMGLDSSHIFLWDQKLFQPTDSHLYIAVSVENCRVFGNNIQYVSSDSGMNSIQKVNMYNLLGIDILSRGPAARDQKELVVAALNSYYAQSQQEANSFYIGKVSTSFINLSQIDGAAIPYRFKIHCALQYAVTKVSSVPYFNQVNPSQVVVNP